MIYMASRDVMSQLDKQSGGKVHIRSETEQVRTMVLQLEGRGVEVRIVIQDLTRDLLCAFF